MWPQFLQGLGWLMCLSDSLCFSFCMQPYPSIPPPPWSAFPYGQLTSGCGLTDMCLGPSFSELLLTFCILCPQITKCHFSTGKMFGLEGLVNTMIIKIIFSVHRIGYDIIHKISICRKQWIVLQLIYWEVFALFTWR